MRPGKVRSHQCSRPNLSSQRRDKHTSVVIWMHYIVLHKSQHSITYGRNRQHETKEAHNGWTAALVGRIAKYNAACATHVNRCFDLIGRIMPMMPPTSKRVEMKADSEALYVSPPIAEDIHKHNHGDNVMKSQSFRRSTYACS